MILLRRNPATALHDISHPAASLFLPILLLTVFPATSLQAVATPSAVKTIEAPCLEVTGVVPQVSVTDGSLLVPVERQTHAGLDVTELSIPSDDIIVPYKMQGADGSSLILVSLKADYSPVALGHNYDSPPRLTTPSRATVTIETESSENRALPTSTIYKVAGKGRISLELETEDMHGVKHKIDPAYIGGYLVSGYSFTTLVKPSSTAHTWKWVPVASELPPEKKEGGIGIVKTDIDDALIPTNGSFKAETFTFGNITNTTIHTNGSFKAHTYTYLNITNTTIQSNGFFTADIHSPASFTNTTLRLEFQQTIESPVPYFNATITQRPVFASDHNESHAAEALATLVVPLADLNRLRSYLRVDYGPTSAAIGKGTSTITKTITMAANSVSNAIQTPREAQVHATTTGFNLVEKISTSMASTESTITVTVTAGRITPASLEKGNYPVPSSLLEVNTVPWILVASVTPTTNSPEVVDSSRIPAVITLTAPTVTNFIGPTVAESKYFIIASCPPHTLIKSKENAVLSPTVNSGGLTKRRQLQAEQLRSLNEAWKNQTHFISCTTDFKAPPPDHSLYLIQGADLRNVSSCEEDLSGPLELKACFNHRACYLYHWDSTTLEESGHFANRPPNWDYFLKPSSGITIADIIASAVGKYDLDRAQTGSKEWKKLYEASLEKWNPSAPGVWEIPVCISNYNWNTPIEPLGTRQPIPCNCGGFGRETQAFWDEMNFGNQYYQPLQLCRNRIMERIPDHLERMIARCSLGIWRTFSQWTRGWEHYCNYWWAHIDERGYKSVEDLTSLDREQLFGIAGTDSLVE